jgi:hypothetical protein
VADAAGATVLLPLGHSPDYDLIADFGGRLLKVQVKTSTVNELTERGHERWTVHVATNGGNQSWTGVAKRFDATRADLLFAVVGDGRRCLIPAREVEGTTAIRLGGDKYSEFEITPTETIQELVYGAQRDASRIASEAGERRSRRAGPVCKIGGLSLSGFDSHLPHSRLPPVDRAVAVGRSRVSSNHQVTIPEAPFEALGSPRVISYGSDPRGMDAC